MSVDNNYWRWRNRDEFDRTELRSTRIVPATTLFIGTAVLTQLIVLSGTAIIMGVAVVTMCAFVVELLVLTLVTTALERGIVSLDELGTLMELAATLMITIITVILASVGNGEKNDETVIWDSSSIAALKFS